MRYRKKAVEVDAILWTGQNMPEVLEFLGQGPNGEEHVFDLDKGEVIIRTVNLEGDWRANRDEYILKHGGRIGVMAKHVFEAIYEPVHSVQEAGSSSLIRQ